MATPPDGHWHRRTPTPIETTSTSRTYGCTHEGCDWTVTVDLSPSHPARWR